MGTWNVRCMNQGKLEVVKKMARLNIDKGWYLQLPQAKDKLDLIYTSSAQMTVPDVTRIP